MMVYFVDIHDYAHISISESSVSQINCDIYFDLEFYNYSYDRVRIEGQITTVDL